MAAKAWILLALASCAAGGPQPPYHLKCQGTPVGLSAERLQHLDKHRLVGIDDPHPMFTWTVAHTERAARQLAFRVVVAGDQNLRNVWWDSDKVYSSDATSLRYGGPKLRTGRTYFWKVMWWDHNGEMAVSEETGHFLVAVLEPKMWESAKWIAADDSINSAPYFHKNIQVGEGEQNATLCVAGLGFQKVFINGIDLNAQFDPPIALGGSWTNYEKRVPYAAYSVPLPGKYGYNLTIGVMLGRGWRNMRDYKLKDPGGIPSSDSTERVLKVVFIYFNFSTNAFVYVYSDETWSVDETNIKFDSIYDGETYVSTQDSKLVVNANVKVVLGPMGLMHIPFMSSIAELWNEKPVKIYSYADSQGNVSQIVDFGSNSAGYCQVESGNVTSYTIHHAEVPMHEPYGNQNGSLYYGNLRGAKATDTYNGTVNSTYKPSFTYHGFQYVEVKGFGNVTLTQENIKKIVIHSNVERTSKFHSSVPLLNNIQENCVRGQLSNLMSVITDCDQRDERLGWMGDASLSAETMALNFDIQEMHSNFVNLIATEIINGTIPDVVPYYRFGYRPADPSWSAAFPEILYRLAIHYLDREPVGYYYSQLMDYINTTLHSIPKEGITQMPNCIHGDWVPPPPNPKVDNTFTGAFSFMISVKQAKELADMLEKTEDVSMLDQTFKNLLNDFNKGFMTSANQYLNGTQATYVLPLAVGAVPDNRMDAFVKAFLNRLEDPKQDNSHVTGGIVTTRHLFPVLSQLKQHDIALKIAQQMDYPSYGFMIHNNLEPATTIWEVWNAHNGSAGMDSRNHHMFSSISGWMVTDMAGISTRKGFNGIHFYPAHALGLSYVSVSLEYPKPIRLSWRRNGGIQCAKQAENQSPLNPNLPLKDDLTVSCGDEDGGTIAKVVFASYGNPTGHCGGYHKKGSCHAPNSSRVVEGLCLGKRSCVVPTGADFWGNPCPSEVKWLMVSVQCKSDGADIDDFVFSSIRVNVSVPVGSHSHLHLPAHGKRDMMLWDGDKIIFTESRGLEATPGISYVQWDSGSDSLVLKLDSGTYDFTWKGDNPLRRCLDFRVSSSNSQTLNLECVEPRDVISTINWASYGSPELTTDSGCFTHVLGECHAGSSKFTMEKECVGKTKCTVDVDQSLFGKLNCLGPNEQGRLIVEYTCNPRVYL